MTGIPVNKLGEDERLRYASMVEHLKERLIGEDEAVLTVSRAIKTARVGLKDPKRPIESFYSCKAVWVAVGKGTGRVHVWQRRCDAAVGYE